jgi:fatty-acyl-CoA synthase
MDDQGRVLERGQPGEVCVRGYSTMLGYWGDEEQTKKSIDNRRWFHMGDVGIMNNDDSLAIVGRIKDMIIRGGENIYPTEIENLILEHPNVKDVQVLRNLLYT